MNLSSPTPEEVSSDVEIDTDTSNIKRKLSHKHKSVSLNTLCSPGRKKSENGDNPYLQFALDPSSAQPNSPRITSAIMNADMATRQLRWSRRKSEPFFNTWDYGNTVIAGSPLVRGQGKLNRVSQSDRAIPSEEVKILQESFSTIQSDRAELKSSMERPADIIFDSPHTVVAGTLAGLTRQLATEDLPDTNYINVFMLTHHYFIPSLTLLEHLMRNFEKAKRSDGTEDEQVAPFIRTRIIHVIRHWITLHPYDFEDSHVGNALKGFLNVLSTGKAHNNAPTWASQISAQLSMCMKVYTATDNDPEGAPRPIMSRKVKGGKVEKFLDLDPREVARQMTILDHTMLRRVPLREFLPMSCRKVPSANVDTIAQRFNQLGQWVSTEVICTPNSKQRTLVLGNMIQLAHELVKLNNMHTAFAIYSGLSATTVQRLEATWHSLSSKLQSRWKALEQLMDPSLNFKHMRTRIAEACSTFYPVIPPLMFILKDLCFMEENEDCYLGNPMLVNFSKMNLLGNVLAKVKDFQMHGFKLQRVPIIQDYINEGLFVMDSESLNVISKKLSRGLLLTWRPMPLLKDEESGTRSLTSSMSMSSGLSVTSGTASAPNTPSRPTLVRQHTSYHLGVPSPKLSRDPPPPQQFSPHRISF